MDIVPTIDYVKVQLEAQSEGSQLRKVVKRLKGLLIKRDVVPQFLVACVTHLTVSDKHSAVYKILNNELDSQKRWSRHRWKKPKNFVQSTESVDYTTFWLECGNTRKLVQCKVYVLDLIFRIADFICNLDTDVVNNWKQLPSSIYRAMENFLDWSQFSDFTRSSSVQHQLYSALDPDVYKTSTAGIHDEDEDDNAALTATVYTLIREKTETAAEALQHYTKLVHAVRNGNEYGPSWLRQIVQNISAGDKIIVSLKRFFRQIKSAIKVQQKRSAFNYTLKHVKRDLQNNINTDSSILKFDPVITLTRVHTTMIHLQKQYSQLELGNYSIFQRSGCCHLVLKKRDESLIVDHIMTHLHINGQFKGDSVPVYAHILSGLTTNNRYVLHQSLHSVYDLIVGYSRNCSYFKKVRSESLLQKSVQLLCKYANCFSPCELLKELSEPYRHGAFIKKDPDTGKISVYAIRNVGTVQSAVRALIMLDEPHYMSWDIFCTLYKELYKEKAWKKKEDKSSWPNLRRWLNTRYTANQHKLLEYGWINMRPKSSFFLLIYEYLLDENCFLPDRAVYFCNAICVKRRNMKLRVPSQLPVLKNLLRFTADTDSTTLYNRYVRKQQATEKEDEYQPEHTGQLMELLKQAEYVRSYSQKRGDPLYRGKLMESISYETAVDVEAVSSKELDLPFKLSERAFGSRNFFPIYDDGLYDAHVPGKPFHTADHELLYCVMCCPFPELICRPTKRRKQ